MDSLMGTGDGGFHAATWVGCSGRLGRDMNLDVSTRPQAVGVFLVVTEVLHCGLKLGHGLILGVATKLVVWVS